MIMTVKLINIAISPHSSHFLFVWREAPKSILSKFPVHDTAVWTVATVDV